MSSNVCIRYTLKDLKKGWKYTGSFVIGVSKPNVVTSDPNFKTRISKCITQIRVIYTTKLFLMMTLQGLPAAGVDPIKPLREKDCRESKVKVDICKNIGFTNHEALSGIFEIDAVEVMISDVDDFVEI